MRPGIAGHRNRLAKGNDEFLYAGTNGISDRAHFFYVTPGRIVELPVFVSLSGVYRAYIPASHSDYDIRSVHHVGIP